MMSLTSVTFTVIVLFTSYCLVYTSFINCSDSCQSCECCTYHFNQLTYITVNFSCDSPDTVNLHPSPNYSPGTELGVDNYGTCISRIPHNICDFPNIVSLSLRNNRISEIPNLSCLKNIIYIDLSYNNIQILKTGIFDSLTKLRHLYLNQNQISTIDANVFNPHLTNIKVVDLSYNSLVTADLWPFNFTNRFCLFDISYNKIQKIVNKQNFRIDLKQTYGAGGFDLSHNNMTVFPEDVLLSITKSNVPNFGIFFDWGFDFRFNPWICDCKFHSFFSLAFAFPSIVYREYMDLKCSSPSKFAGRLVHSLQLTDFVCNVTLKCPDKCLCQDQPANSRFVVDCSGVGLSSLPDELPSYNNLFVNFKDNNITKLNMRPYLHNITYLDISMNQLDFIDNKAVENLMKVKYWNLSNNHLMDLPENIQKLNNMVELDISNNNIQCSCSNLWLSTWLPSGYNINKSSNIKCFTSDNEEKSIINVDEDQMNCKKKSFSKIYIIIISVLVTVFIFIVVICTYFRFEIYTLYYIYIFRKVHKKCVNTFSIKCFISCYDGEEEIRSWVINNILKLFQENSINNYCTFRDSLPGDVSIDTNIKKIHECNLVLAVVSESYLNDQSLMFQLNEIYHDKIIKDNGKLIIIKLGNYPSSYIYNPYIKSLFRLKRYINDTDSKLFLKLSEKIQVNSSSNAEFDITKDSS